jgi:hypothetical protein
MSYAYSHIPIQFHVMLQSFNFNQIIICKPLYYYWWTWYYLSSMKNFWNCATIASNNIQFAKYKLVHGFKKLVNKKVEVKL